MNYVLLEHLKKSDFDNPLLRNLNLSDNCLTELPVELSQLDELMMFDISRNDQITKIPNEFGQLRNLFSFRVDGLNQLQIPKDLRPTDGKNVRPMLDFLSQEGFGTTFFTLF